MALPTPVTLASRVERELRDNILPFWITNVVDPHSGGFYGALANDLKVHDEIERTAVLNARILWTFSAAYRAYRDPAYLATARRALDALCGTFRDTDYGGVYWSVDSTGRPVNDRKHAYAQAFTIHGLAEWVAATGDQDGLAWAQDLFRLVERHTHDSEYGGNIECRARDWAPLADMRLSDKEPQAPKTMNTLLHLMEAYTNLRRVWHDQQLGERHEDLIRLFLRRVLDADNARFRLFFDLDWRPLPDCVSPGHDIEGSWLLVEAAEVAGRSDLLAETQAVAVKMAAAVLRDGLDGEGFVIYEGAPHPNYERHWWPQAEALVGFYNAYQLTGRAAFRSAVDRLWDLIERDFVDRRHGEWFKIILATGEPKPGQVKIGPWECPYHHGRACLELQARLPKEETHE